MDGGQHGDVRPWWLNEFNLPFERWHLRPRINWSASEKEAQRGSTIRSASFDGQAAEVPRDSTTVLVAFLPPATDPVGWCIRFDHSASVAHGHNDHGLSQPFRPPKLSPCEKHILGHIFLHSARLTLIYVNPSLFPPRRIRHPTTTVTSIA